MPKSKEERYADVARVVAGLLLRAGPDAVRVSTVARLAGVSRPWLYKYLGGEPDDLIRYAVRDLGVRFSQLDQPVHAADVPAWRAAIAARAHQGLRDAVLAPQVMEGVQRFIRHPGLVGALIRDIEDQHVARFVADMPAALTADPEAARAFARRFSALCLGMYHRWADPTWRADQSADAVVAELMAALDAWIAGR
jgi:AcrR family transcriptional regulator